MLTFLILELGIHLSNIVFERFHPRLVLCNLCNLRLGACNILVGDSMGGFETGCTLSLMCGENNFFAVNDLFLASCSASCLLIFRGRTCHFVLMLLCRNLQRFKRKRQALSIANWISRSPRTHLSLRYRHLSAPPVCGCGKTPPGPISPSALLIMLFKISVVWLCERTQPRNTRSVTTT